MGLTCASLHLYSRDLSSAMPSLGPLAQDLGNRLEYERIDNPEEAERHFVVAVAPPWFSFFDLTNPDAITEESVNLGKQLSAASQCPVLFTSVVDSDAFACLLFEKGKQVDGYASTRGLLPGRIKKWPSERRAAEWSRLFERPIGTEDMRALTEKGMVFADDLLVRLCNLVGLSPELAAVTASDLAARPLPNQLPIYYRSRPGAATGLQVKQNVGYKGPTLARRIGLGEVASVSFELNGPAGAFTDPVLELSGSAIDSGMVTLLDGYGLWALGMEQIRAGNIKRVHASIATAEVEGQGVLRACLQGLSADRFAFAPRKQSILCCWANLRGVAMGAGELRVSCLPSALAQERLALRPLHLIEVT